MAECGLPAGLEMLKIDLKRDLDDCGMSNEPVNPFSVVGNGTRKKVKTEGISSCNVEEQKCCPLGIFGTGCAESTSRSAVAPCRCSVYVPNKFRNHGKRSGQDGSLLQVKSGSVFKRNVVQKGKLNFLKSHEGSVQSCQQLESLTQGQNAKLIARRGCTPSSEPASDADSSEQSARSQVAPAEYVQDFKSLIPSSQKQRSSDTGNGVFNNSSFRTFQNNRAPCRHSFLPHDEKGEEEDLVNSVSRKLSVTGLASTSNASCSQEARLTANVYCDEHDISIDELASYFEDFVHIPKKMSLMAEQMYI